MTTDNYSDYDDYDSLTTAPTEEGVLCQLELHPMGTLVQTYVHSFIFVLGLLGNLLVVVTYACYKKRRTMTDLFLLNVAAADLLFIAALPLTIYNEHRGWLTASHGACKLARGVYSVNLYAGMLLLACVGGDRYMAIVQARRFFGARAWTLIPGRLVCGAVWALAVALSLPTVIYTTHLVEVDLDTKQVSASCHMSFSSNATAKHMKVLVPTLQVVVGFLLPLALMVFCYGSVLHCLLRAQAGNQKRKAVRVVLAVVAVFVACHLPYNAALMSHTLGLLRLRSCAGEVRKRNVLAVTRSVAYLHCCLNAILYAFVGVKFRYHFKKILQDMWCVGKKFAHPSCSSVNAVTSVSVLGSRSASVSNNMPTFSA
ncbi:unnamed protein product [Merluccius merluccius]